LVLLYQRGGLVWATGITNHQHQNPPQASTCGFFVATFGKIRK